MLDLYIPVVLNLNFFAHFSVSSDLDPLYVANKY